MEGRDLSSRQTQQVVRDLEIGQPINSENCSETTEGVARESEGRSRLSLLRAARSVARTRAHRGQTVRTSRTLRRMASGGGLANWRLRSGRRAIDRILSEECLYRRPTASSGRCPRLQVCQFRPLRTAHPCLRSLLSWPSEDRRQAFQYEVRAPQGRNGGFVPGDSAF